MSIVSFGDLDLPEKEYRLEPEKEINLSRGDLNFNTPSYIVDAAYKAMKNGYTHYVYRYGMSSYTAPQLGLPDLRNAIRQYYRKYGVIYEEDEILVTSGSASALYIIFNRYLNKGDEVIVTEPTYPGYFKILNRIGTKIAKMPLKREDNWELDTSKLNDKISKETKMIVLCNPLNPTGKVLSMHELEAVADIVQDREIKILSDEIYNEYIWNGLKHNALTKIQEMYCGKFNAAFWLVSEIKIASDFPIYFSARIFNQRCALGVGSIA